MLLHYCSSLELGLRALSKFCSTAGLAQYGQSIHALETASSIDLDFTHLPQSFAAPVKRLRQGVYWECEQQKWKWLPGAKEASSYRAAPNSFTSLPRLLQRLHSSEVKNASSKTSLKQCDTMDFSTWRANPKNIEERVPKNRLQCGYSESLFTLQMQVFLCSLLTGFFVLFSF